MRPAQWRDAIFDSLAADERERALRFRLERDRQRFVVARAALRLILGRYLSRPPTEIALAFGPNGKPSLADAGPRFSVTHCEDLALVALADAAELGVDVERLGRELDVAPLIAHFASTQERADFDALGPQEQRSAFFHWWTRKEALLKAVGGGLSLPLDGFDVTIAPGDARLVGTRIAEFNGAWSLQDLSPAPGYVGALASPGAPLAIETRPFGFDES